MKHRLQIRDYRRAMGTTVRQLPDGRRLIIRNDREPLVIDKEGEEFAVSSSDLKALMALSEMSFPNPFCVSDWNEDERIVVARAA